MQSFPCGKACLQAGTIAILQTYNSVTATAAALPRLRLSTILQFLRKEINSVLGCQLKQRSQRRNHLHCTGNSMQSWAAAQPPKTQYLHRLVQRILEKNVSDFWQLLLRVRLRADELHQLVLCTYFIFHTNVAAIITVDILVTLSAAHIIKTIGLRAAGRHHHSTPTSFHRLVKRP